MKEKEPGRHQDLLSRKAVVIEVARDMRPTRVWPASSEEPPPLALEQYSSLPCTYLADKKTEAPWHGGSGPLLLELL